MKDHAAAATEARPSPGLTAAKINVGSAGFTRTIRDTAPYGTGSRSRRYRQGFPSELADIVRRSPARGTKWPVNVLAIPEPEGAFVAPRFHAAPTCRAYCRRRSGYRLAFSLMKRRPLPLHGTASLAIGQVRSILVAAPK
jgi:hypothetical protein